MRAAVSNDAWGLLDIHRHCHYAIFPTSDVCGVLARWAVSSAGRALPSQGRGREFESPTVHSENKRDRDPFSGLVNGSVVP